MRFERWYWMPIFLFASLVIHMLLAVATRNVHDTPGKQDTASIEVNIEPLLPQPPQKPPKVVPPKPKPVAVVAAPVTVPRHRAVAVTRGTDAVPIRPYRVARADIKPVPERTSPYHVVRELPDAIAREIPQATVREVQPLPLRPHSEPQPIAGGGSPSPAPNPTGHGGFKAPEAPKEDVLYTGGGRGGENLANAPPRIGGGGGKSILSVKGENPLASTIPEDKPGIGPGTGGGQGTGRGGGNGFATGRGIGTDPNGHIAIGSLRRKPGSGIGAADSGSEVGTKPPGGGRGRGADLPGTGGTGNGYGRGPGNGLGDGTGDEGPPTRMRGVPFGDVGSLLGGGPGGPGGGGPARGTPFGPRPLGGGGGPIHIIYALDISGSMRDGHKIDKAKEALKKALAELRPRDTFNIITFKRDASTFRDDSVPATLGNIASAMAYVDEIRIGDGTNISSAMDLALDMNGITHIYLMSDGEPNGGIGDFNELRQYIRDKNTHHIKITTLALGLGENFPGMRLLKGIADDNNGTFGYINMAKIATPSR